MKYDLKNIYEQDDEDIQELAQLMSSTSSIYKVSLQLFKSKAYENQVIQAFKYQQMEKMLQTTNDLIECYFINSQNSLQMVRPYFDISQNAWTSKVRGMFCKEQMKKEFFFIEQDQSDISLFFKILKFGIVDMFLKPLFKKYFLNQIRKVWKIKKKKYGYEDQVRKQVKRSKLQIVKQKLKNIMMKIWYYK